MEGGVATTWLVWIVLQRDQIMREWELVPGKHATSGMNVLHVEGSTQGHHVSGSGLNTRTRVQEEVKSSAVVGEPLEKGPSSIKAEYLPPQRRCYLPLGSL